MVLSAYMKFRRKLRHLNIKYYGHVSAELWPVKVDRVYLD